MKIIKKLTAGLMGVLLCVSLSLSTVCAEDKNPRPTYTIRQELNVSSCRQGDTITLTVYLQGDDSIDGWKLSSVKGILEYDNSLFAVESGDVLPVQSSRVSRKSFASSSCQFSIAYDSDITVQNNAPVVQLKLHVNGKATTGKTTVCVTNLEWQTSDGTERYEVEHRIPSSVTISEAEEPVVAGDVNLDGKVNLADVKYIMQYCNGTKILNSNQKKNADVNGDGKVTLTDAKLVMKYCNNEIDKL